MLFEDPSVLVWIGVIFCFACVAMWYMSRHPLPLAGAAASLMLTAVIVVTSVVVQTPREQVEQTLHWLAMAAQQNDKELLLSMVSKKAIAVQQDADREMDATTFVQCWITKIDDITLDEKSDPPHARAILSVFADVQRSFHGEGRGLVKLLLDLDKESDGKWRVTQYSYAVE